MNSNLTIAINANNTHKTGTPYMDNQKNFESVGFMIRDGYKMLAIPFILCKHKSKNQYSRIEYVSKDSCGPYIRTLKHPYLLSSLAIGFIPPPIHPIIQPLLSLRFHKRYPKKKEKRHSCKQENHTVTPPIADRRCSCNSKSRLIARG